MNSTDSKKTTKRVLMGTVLSDRGNKTVVVEVRSVKKHPRYHKQYTVSKRYQAHDENNEYRAGDAVRIEECRPLSKTKRFRVVEKLAKV